MRKSIKDASTMEPRKLVCSFHFLYIEDFKNVISIVTKLNFNIIRQVVKSFYLVPTLNENQRVIIIVVEPNLVKVSIIFLNLPILFELVSKPASKIGFDLSIVLQYIK
jgi:hypothetical protein